MRSLRRNSGRRGRADVCEAPKGPPGPEKGSEWEPTETLPASAATHDVFVVHLRQALPWTGVQSRGEPLEEDVADEVRACEADERLGEAAVLFAFPLLAFPGMPALREDLSERFAADRDGQRVVIGEVTSGVEGDEEIPGRIDAEEDGREEPERVGVARRGPARPCRNLNRRRGTVGILGVRAEQKELPGQADPLEKRVLVRQPTGVFPRAGDAKQFASGTGGRFGDVAKKRAYAADRRT